MNHRSDYYFHNLRNHIANEHMVNKGLFIPVFCSVATQPPDPNEALTKDRAAFTQEVQHVLNTQVLNMQDEIKAQQEREKEAERKAYQQTAASFYLEEFNQGIKDSVNTPYIPTGFDALDSVLDGGLYEGLYIIGAISSLGKTTLVLQIADQIAQQGQDVLIFSLEMARSELMAKSLSRLTLTEATDRRHAKTTRGITTGKRYPFYSRDELELIRKAMTEYATYANNLYIIEGRGKVGAEKIRGAVAKHLSITGRKPIIIIDYLQILAPLDPRATDKRNTDDAVRELKEISRDYKTPVLAISSFNRENYSTAVSMTAFKESGAIEYSSDVLIGLQAVGAGQKDFNIDEAKRKDPREIELKILKNRNGRTGDTLQYDYYPLFNYFRETTRNFSPITGSESKNKR